MTVYTNPSCAYLFLFMLQLTKETSLEKRGEQLTK